MSEPVFRSLALMELAEAALAQKKLSEARHLLELADTSLPTNHKLLVPRRNRLQLLYLLAENKADEVLKLLDGTPYPRELSDEKLYLRAKAYEIQGKMTEAAQFYQLAVRQLPLQENISLEAVRFYNTQDKSSQRAYELLLSGLAFNPYSVPLLKAYVMQCASLSLWRYAALSLEDLQLLDTPASYQAFLKLYQEKKAAVEKERADFKINP